MQTHTIGTDTYAIFDKSDNGGVWMVQFLWGKKDFRIYLERAGSTPSEKHLPGLLNSESTGNHSALKLARFKELRLVVVECDGFWFGKSLGQQQCP